VLLAVPPTGFVPTWHLRSLSAKVAYVDGMYRLNEYCQAMEWNVRRRDVRSAEVEYEM
jgi:hypothetical protein